MEICKIVNCNTESKKAGFCASHYMQDWLSRDKGVCSKDNCNTKVYIRNLCSKHYTAWKRARADLPMCSVEDCDSKAVSKGMCHRHYKINQRKIIKCKIEGCENTLHSKGLCTTHWREYKKSIFLSIEGLLLPGVIDLFTDLFDRVHGKIIELNEEDKDINSALSAGTLLKQHTSEPKTKTNRTEDCKEKGCNRPHRAKGFCVSHYNKWKSATEAKICKIENCKKFVYAKRLCSKHYQQAQKKVAPPKKTFTVCKIESCKLRSRYQGMCKKHADQFLPKPKCTIEGCKRTRYSRKMCNTHYYLWRQENITNECSVEECTKVVRAKKLCSTHYQKQLVGKDLNSPTRKRLPVEAVSIREVEQTPREPVVNIPIEVYKEIRKPAEPKKKRQAEKIIPCNVVKCSKPAKTRGLCVKHYLRYSRNITIAKEQKIKEKQIKLKQEKQEVNA